MGPRLQSVWEFLKKVPRDTFTERDGKSYCIGRFIGAGAWAAATYAFLKAPTPDFIGYSAAVGAIISAVAFKNISERD
jgi:hypothetical protein